MTAAAWGRNIRVDIGVRVRVDDLRIHVAGDGACISIDDDTSLESGCRFDATERGSKIRIGGDCVSSTDLHIRTSDNHGIVGEDGRRANPAQDVAVGDHVWVGDGALLSKGSRVASGSVVGARAVVTRAFDEPAAILVGAPARVARRRITWSRSFRLESGNVRSAASVSG